MSDNLKDSQINKISEIVKNNMDILSYIMTGSPIPDKNLLDKLGISPEIVTMIMLAYKYGKYNASLPSFLTNQLKKLKNIPMPNINQVQNVSLNSAQQLAARRLTMRANQLMSNFTQRTVTSVVNSAINISFQSWGDYSTGKNTWSKGQWIQQLRDTTKDMERDWHRVVQTELWNAKLHGEAHAIMSGDSPFSSDKGETLVYKRPAPDCCPICRKLYLEKDGITPKVFKLSELVSNGDNYGKKQDEWLPTLGTVHPHCQCTLGIKAKDTEFDKDGNLVFKAAN